MGRCVETHFQEESAELQIPPLRYATVGMTLLLGTDRRTHSFQQPPSMEPLSFPLSSRPTPRDLRFNGPLLESFLGVNTILDATL
jgi:hypothetical protein